MAGDIFGCPQLSECNQHLVGRGRDAIKIPQHTRKSLTINNYLAQNINSSTVEKPCFSHTDLLSVM